MGVDNDGVAVGTTEQKLDETVANVVRDSCDPTVEL